MSQDVENQIGGYDADAVMDLVTYGQVWLDGDGKRIDPKTIFCEPDITKCHQCGGIADNGHDREYPPNPYFCTKCESVATVGGGSNGASLGDDRVGNKPAPDFASADAGKGATSGNGSCPNIIELQRKADMADELAGVMEKVSAMIPQDLNDERFGRVTNPAYYTLKDALAKYRGRSHATTETGERVDVATEGDV